MLCPHIVYYDLGREIFSAEIIATATLDLQTAANVEAGLDQARNIWWIVWGVWQFQENSPLVKWRKRCHSNH
jgi:hypothetical protein